ncbi:MAG: KpsF/GutQ family sugar-phosphate isomerase [Deltaproteobacteria bacterium]|jgi:arabinose-5-phosphate isomerase|nr:KpsF/GutQ family sugar-phosphate isomerase [Deltaproteobacteria bacterium]
MSGNTGGRDWLETAREALNIEIEGLEAVRANLDRSFNAAVELLAACRGRVAVTGLGKSGLVGRKIAATFSSTGTPSFFMHPVEGQHGDLGLICADDVVIAISNSGASDELNAILPVLRSLGVSIIALTGKVKSPMADLADIVLNSSVPREACPLNLAPTSSTTAALALGDALAVCLITYKEFSVKDFKRVHPGGSLGQRLREPVSALMRGGGIPCASSDASLEHSLNVLNLGGLGVLLLLDERGKTVGVMTDGDVRRALCAGRCRPDVRVAEIMTRNFQYAHLGQSAAEILDIMENKSITTLPVLDEEKRPLGIIHLHDLLGKGKIKFSGQ